MMTIIAVKDVILPVFGFKLKRNETLSIDDSFYSNLDIMKAVSYGQIRILKWEEPKKKEDDLDDLIIVTDDAGD